MKISVIIPVYNNAGSLALLIENFESLFSDSINDIFEFIFVDDGSKDNSFDILNKYCILNEKKLDLKIIKLTRNFGQVSAIIAGYNHAQGDYIVNISADLQDPPELILDMIQNCKKGFEVVIAERTNRDESYYRKLTSSIFYKIMKKWCFPDIPAGGFDYVMISRKVMILLISSQESNPFWQGQILWTGFKQKRIGYNRKKRYTGKSGWSFVKKITYLLDGILAYSYQPMRLMMTMGFITSLIGFLYAIIIIIFKFLGKIPQPGWAPIMVVILVLFGINMLMVGVIGEYLWRTLDQVRNRPKYIVEKVVE